ncbi:MAG: Na(+)-translocating NADH-quinone reductase subunit C [Thermodesulfobacteriota bacterium]
MAVCSVRKTFGVAFLLCIVCALLVSSAAVLLRPRQEMNRTLDLKKNILLAGGLLKDAKAGRQEIEEAFDNVEAVVVDLESGDMVAGLEPAAFDPRRPVVDPALRHLIPTALDKAKIKVRSRYGVIYLVKENGETRQIILPVQGKGLWSTLYGFIALAKDTKTVKGITFYQHGETPGLGGEVDRPEWQAQWQGKIVFDPEWLPNIRLVKGGKDADPEVAAHQVDAISGATITSRGVENMLLYWLGQDGFGPFLAQMRRQGGKQ